MEHHRLHAWKHPLIASRSSTSAALRHQQHRRYHNETAYCLVQISLPE